MAARPAIISDKQITMRVERRALAQPRPGMAEARHEYTEVFTVRAKVKTYSGTAEWNTIAVDGKTVTHLWEIRFHRIPFDPRDRIRDAENRLYQILKVENVDLANRTLKVYSALIGAGTIPANQ